MDVPGLSPEKGGPQLFGGARLSDRGGLLSAPVRVGAPRHVDGRIIGLDCGGIGARGVVVAVAPRGDLIARVHALRLKILRGAVDC